MSKDEPRTAVDVGVLVKDLERSLAFYRDLLDLPVINEVQLSLLGQGRMVQLRYGHSLIKLIELERLPHKQISADITEALGYRYITLLVPDIRSVVTRLEQAGVAITLPITNLANSAQIAMVTDPDGNVLEFVQES